MYALVGISVNSGLVHLLWLLCLSCLGFWCIWELRNRGKDDSLDFLSVTSDFKRSTGSKKL